MPFSLYALDKFVAPNLSKLTECNATDLSSRLGQSTSWVTNFVLNTAFRFNVEDATRALIFTFLRKAEMALAEYRAATRTLDEYVSGTRARISVYFRALYHFEAAIGQAWQAGDYLRKFTDKRIFAKGDGSGWERLNRIYNESRHHLPETGHPVWLTNDGLEATGVQLAFTEIETILGWLAKSADRLSNPEPPGSSTG